MSKEEQQKGQLESMCPHGNFLESCEICEEEKSTSDLESAEVKYTKETAQQELQEKFGIIDTSAFRDAIQHGDIETAKQWLQYIINNQEHFPQY